MITLSFFNDYKNIYFRNNNVCLGVCGMVFMKFFFSIKKCYESVFVFAGIRFMGGYKFHYFFSMKKGYRSVLGYG